MSQKHGAQTPNYKTIRNLLLKKNLSYRIRKEFSESDENKVIFSLETLYNHSSTKLLVCDYKPPKGDNDMLSMFFKQVFKMSDPEKKPYYLIGDLNINCLEYFENEKVLAFYNSLIGYGPVGLINKPTRVVKNLLL